MPTYLHIQSEFFRLLEQVSSDFCHRKQEHFLHYLNLLKIINHSKYDVNYSCITIYLSINKQIYNSNLNIYQLMMKNFSIHLFLENLYCRYCIKRMGSTSSCYCSQIYTYYIRVPTDFVPLVIIYFLQLNLTYIRGEQVRRIFCSCAI